MKTITLHASLPPAHGDKMIRTGRGGKTSRTMAAGSPQLRGVFARCKHVGPGLGRAPAALSKQQATQAPGSGAPDAQGLQSPHPGVRSAFRENRSRWGLPCLLSCSANLSSPLGLSGCPQFGSVSTRDLNSERSLRSLLFGRQMMEFTLILPLPAFLEGGQLMIFSFRIQLELV